MSFISVFGILILLFQAVFCYLGSRESKDNGGKVFIQVMFGLMSAFTLLCIILLWKVGPGFYAMKLWAN